MKKIILLTLFLTSLFAQYEIEGRWHLVDYEDNVTYEFDINIDQKGFPYETLDQVFCSPAIIDIDQNNKLISIKGSIPGKKNAVVFIKDAIKKNRVSY